MTRVVRRIVFIFIVFATATTVILTGFGNFATAQDQVNYTTSSLTPEQRDAICNPNNPSSNLNPVNTTESKICGIPKTLNTTSSTTPDTTTGAEAPPDTSKAPSDTSTTLTTPNQSSLYEQGYAKAVSDAKLVQSSSPASTTMSPDMVDCDSSVDPQTSNVDYCSGYQHGFADTNNNALSGK